MCQFIPQSRVPILLVKSKLNDISCDISVNNLKAQMKSKLLLWINDIDPHFHDMVLLVKEWAKAHNINNSKFGTFNSYSLSLLVVFHFQTCAPAILPPLPRHISRNSSRMIFKSCRLTQSASRCWNFVLILESLLHPFLLQLLLVFQRSLRFQKN